MPSKDVIKKREAVIAPQLLHVGPVSARSRSVEETAGIYSRPLVRASIMSDGPLRMSMARIHEPPDPLEQGVSGVGAAIQLVMKSK